MKIIKSLEDAGLLIKCVSETIENHVKEQTGGFLGMVAATLGKCFINKFIRKNVSR